MWGFWVIFVLLLMFLIALPVYPHSRQWGYYPSGAAAAGMLFVLILIWLGYLIFAWPWASEVR